MQDSEQKAVDWARERAEQAIGQMNAEIRENLARLAGKR